MLWVCLKLWKQPLLWIIKPPIANHQFQIISFITFLDGGKGNIPHFQTLPLHLWFVCLWQFELPLCLLIYHTSSYYFVGMWDLSYHYVCSETHASLWNRFFEMFWYYTRNKMSKLPFCSADDQTVDQAVFIVACDIASSEGRQQFGQPSAS